jgi:hypothetical protein
MGKIPTNLKYISQAVKQTVKTTWDNFGGTIFTVVVSPTFVVDAESEKTIETAKAWAGRNHTVIDMPNDPITDVKIVGLSYRSEGGRAYKVVFGQDNYYADLREDVLLDAILNVGINPGGLMNGSYIWVKNGSQMKLIRYGSDLHNYFAEESVKVKEPNIANKDLVVNGIYENRYGQKYVYLGRVSTIILDVEQKENPFPTTNYDYTKRNGGWQRYTNTVTKSRKKTSGLWISSYYGSFVNDLDTDEKFKKYVSSCEIKEATVIKKIGDAVVTPNAIEIIRRESKKDVLGYAKNLALNQVSIADMADKVNISPAGKLHIDEDYTKLFPEIFNKND